MPSSNDKTLTERLEQRRQAGTLPRFIAVEGPIGAGKTSLARRLAMTFGYDLLLEQAHQGVAERLERIGNVRGPPNFPWVSP